MELLVATLAYTSSGRDGDVLARVRFIYETVRNAPGLITSRLYRGGGKESLYFILTTWDEEESWRKAQEKHGLKRLLLESSEMLSATPQQWLMSYIWGYSRPAALPVVAAAHLASVRAEQVEFVQQGYIKGLRQQAIQPMLAFALLARGVNEESYPVARQGRTLEERYGASSSSRQPNSIFLSLFSWASEEEREDFYADSRYRTVDNFMSSHCAVHVLPLEPL
jgi:quinol monooxygenase YgiN